MIFGVGLRLQEDPGVLHVYLHKEAPEGHEAAHEPDKSSDPVAAFYWNETRWVLLLAALFAVPLWPHAEAKLPRNVPGQLLRAAVYTLVLLVSVSYLAMGAHNPFIYFNF